MSNVLNFVQAGGIVMIPLLLMSIASIAIIIERWMVFRQDGDLAPGLTKRVVRLVDEGAVEDAIRTCDSKPGPVAACLAAILRNREHGVSHAERKVQEVGEKYFHRLEKFLPILDTTTTISPLLGLLGTLFGMIGTFQAISASRDQNANDRILSGVGEALYATATGLTIAVICFIAYNYFGSRQRTVVSETEQAATTLINAMVASGAIREKAVV
ncbi:MAG: MotA/TolQ/ExbB proton channel family protein [Chlorobia bacterium]|nr:MotA/TolQ/ExbB proton channel family protein [Fimbriimonadaceae bacterium]